MSNKIKHCTVYFIWKLLYMFWVVLSPIIIIFIIIIIGSTALGGPWPSLEALPICLCRDHPSSGAQTTVSTASGICHTVTAYAYATHSTLRPVLSLPR